MSVYTLFTLVDTQLDLHLTLIACAPWTTSIQTRQTTELHRSRLPCSVYPMTASSITLIPHAALVRTHAQPTGQATSERRLGLNGS